MRVPPAAAVFDNDGLLLDTEGAWTRAEEKLFERYGSTFTPEHKRQLIGTSHLLAVQTLEAMLGRPGEGEALVAELQGMVIEEARTGPIEIRPGAEALLKELRAAGVPLGLASNSERAFVDLVLGRSGLAPCFDTVVAGDEVPAPKPEPDIYLEACRRLGAEPADSVALEDSPTGIAAARAAGMRVVGVPYLPGLDLAADVVAPSLDDPAVLRFLGLS
jgi:HAD superfamily hydrolase (TIGR01509 family)